MGPDPTLWRKWSMPAVVTATLLTLILPALASDLETPRLRINYLAYPVESNGKTVRSGHGFRCLSTSRARCRPVIMLHGTSGVPYSGVYYAAALNRAGIVTLEVDQWGGRGLPGGPSSRPKRLTDNLPDVAGAYRLLAGRSEVDADHIGLMGNSMGGIQTLLMMTRRNSNAVLGHNIHVKAAVAFYPACWLYNHVPDAEFADLVDAPIRIFAGAEDDYDGDPDVCNALVRDLAPIDAAHVSVRVFPGATHLFDSFEGARQYDDPGSHRRQGGVVRVQPNPDARENARDDLVKFFSKALSMMAPRF